MLKSQNVMLGCAFAASTLLASSAMAESSKFSAATNDHVMLKGTEAGYTTVLSSGIRMPNQKDLFVQTAMECGLYTQTLVSSLGGTTDTSVAEAVIRARVILDPGTANEKLAFPGEITLCGREQAMSGTFNGVCSDDNNDGVVNYDECDEPEELNLTMKTLNANAFNFVLTDLTPGEHIIAVQAKIDSSTSFENGSAAALGIVGNGSLGVEEVQMVKSIQVQEDDAGAGEDTWDAFDTIIDMSL